MARRPQPDFSHMRFTGGIDTETPRWNVPPGFLQASINYEVGRESGYQDIAGYERYDGSSSPSDAVYLSLPIVLRDGANEYQELLGGDGVDKTLIGKNVNNGGGSVERIFDISQPGISNAIFSGNIVHRPELPGNTGGVELTVSSELRGPRHVEIRSSFLNEYLSGTSSRRLSVEIRYINTQDHALLVSTSSGGTHASIHPLRDDSAPGNYEAVKGTEVVDWNGSGETVSRDGGWRIREFNLDQEDDWIRFTLNDVGTVQICCVIIYNVQITSITSNVLAVDQNSDGDYFLIINTKYSRSEVDEIELAESVWQIGDPVFVQDESLQLAEASGKPRVLDATTAQRHAIYRARAADERRQHITSVPGSGRVLGMWWYGSHLYAVRNDDPENPFQDAQARIHKATDMGWERVELNHRILYTNGGVGLKKSKTLTQGSATAEIIYVTCTNGDPVAGTATGWVIVKDVSGDFSEGTAQVETEDVCTLAKSDANDANSPVVKENELLPDTVKKPVRYETRRGDFGDGEAIYAVDGKNFAFRFDDDTFAPIYTGYQGPGGDAPQHVEIHRNHLFLSFGRSVQHSGIGNPFKWTVLSGASEIATEFDVTGFHVEAGVEGTGALGIFNRNRIFILYGSSEGNWQLQTYRKEIGAFSHTIQEVSQTVFQDDRGIRTLQSVQEFGNFNHATISGHAKGFLLDRGRYGADKVIGSCIAREKNQYRIFYADNHALFITFKERKLLGIMPVFFDRGVVTVFSTEDQFGRERMFFGTNDGFVMEMEKGTSFDGQPIRAYLLTHYHFIDSIGWRKRVTNAVVEAMGTAFATFELSSIQDYNLRTIGDDAELVEVLDSIAGSWDENLTWDQFTWDGIALGPSRHKLHGNCENIAFLVKKDSDYMQPVLLSGVQIRYQLTKQIK